MSSQERKKAKLSKLSVLKKNFSIIQVCLESCFCACCVLCHPGAFCMAACSPNGSIFMTGRHSGSIITVLNLYVFVFMLCACLISLMYGQDAVQLYELLRPKSSPPEKRQELVNQIITKVP